MSVLVDTPIWSLAYRRKRQKLSASERILVDAWSELVVEGRVVLIGPVRQEVLSGIREEGVYLRVRDVLRGFDDVALGMHHFEQAAVWANRCRGSGIAGSVVDYLICAVALMHDLEIMTTDRDFDRYARHLPIRLFKAGGRDARAT